MPGPATAHLSCLDAGMAGAELRRIASLIENRTHSGKCWQAQQRGPHPSWRQHLQRPRQVAAKEAPKAPGMLEPCTAYIILPRERPRPASRALRVSSMVLCSPAKWGSPDQTVPTTAQPACSLISTHNSPHTLQDPECSTALPHPHCPVTLELPGPGSAGGGFHEHRPPPREE